MAEQSISEILEALGYGHRPSRFDGRREVFQLGTGEVIGQLWAGDAIAAAQAHAASKSEAA